MFTHLLLGLVLAHAPAPGAAAVGAVPRQPCAVTLSGLDQKGDPLFRTVAMAIGPGLIATPLHTLERGGARWERLQVERTEVTGVVTLDPAGDLVYLSVPGLEACAAEGLTEGAGVPAAGVLDAGATIGVLRERAGYRPAIVGGRVERSLGLGNGDGSILLHLLDDRGASPGLVFDVEGRLVGSVAPAPSGTDLTYAAIIATAPRAGASDHDPGTDPPRTPRAAIVTRASPSSLDWAPGLLCQALLYGASGRTTEGLRRLDDVIERAGESAPLLIERGVLEFGAGGLAAAVQSFTRASDLDPASHLARYDLGMALGASGRYRAAADAFARARDLLPAHGRTRFQLAMALKAANLTDAARGEYDALHQLDPTLARELGLLLGF